MHVAKAAGSTVNDVIAQQFSADEVALHFESIPIEDNRILQSKKFISGHPFYYSAKNRLPFIDGFFKVTVFRKPTNQLMSHIAWVRRLAEPQNLMQFYKHAKHFQEMAIRLRNMDLSCPKELAAFANNLNKFEQTTFSNFQTRYLIPKSPNNISLADFNIIKNVLSEFDIIGTTESLDEFFMALFKAMNWVYPEDICNQNIAGEYFGLDPEDPAQQDALYPLLKHDLRLYDIISTNCV
jgi:hypothetical protein